MLFRPGIVFIALFAPLWGALPLAHAEVSALDRLIHVFSPANPDPPSIAALSAESTRSQTTSASTAHSAPLSTPPTELKADLKPLHPIDLTETPDNILVRIRNGFGMPDLNTPQVAIQQAAYLNHPQSLIRALQRSRRYMFHIVEELQKRGMPTELALLPVVESSFNPMARSPARALGLWQFIPSTGRHYDLEQNALIDERRDIIASTAAALDYLMNIYTLHGDWFLALASYNWGEGAVARAVAKNRSAGLPTDYAHLRMPRETANYVPKLQAIKNIVAHPERFGIDLPPIPNKPYFGTIEVDELLGVVAAARLAETPLDEFLALNPAYRHPVIPGESRRPLVLPADKVAVFQRNLDALEAADKPLSTWTTYALKKGETLGEAAHRFSLPPALLAEVNDLKPGARLSAGQTLLIPDIEALPPHLAQVFAEPVSVLRKTCKRCKARKAAAQGRGRAAKLATRATSPRRKTRALSSPPQAKAPKKKARATINPPRRP